MSVVADVQEVFACAGTCSHRETRAGTRACSSRASSQETADTFGQTSHQWFLSLADRLHAHGWKKKDVFMNCQRWCWEIFGNVHADTVYRWKLDGPGSGGGKSTKISGAVPEKLTVLTHVSSRFLCVARDHAYKM